MIPAASGRIVLHPRCLSPLGRGILCPVWLISWICALPAGQISQAAGWSEQGRVALAQTNSQTFLRRTPGAPQHTMSDPDGDIPWENALHELLCCSYLFL